MTHLTSPKKFGVCVVARRHIVGIYLLRYHDINKSIRRYLFRNWLNSKTTCHLRAVTLTSLLFIVCLSSFAQKIRVVLSQIHNQSTAQFKRRKILILFNKEQVSVAGYRSVKLDHIKFGFRFTKIVWHCNYKTSADFCKIACFDAIVLSQNAVKILIMKANWVYVTNKQKMLIN